MKSADALLAERLRDLGYTPSVRELAALLQLVEHGEEDDARAAARAVLRIDPGHARRTTRDVVTQARAASRPGRGRLTALLGRLAALASDETAQREARTWLLEALVDPDPKTRRGAARALSRLPRTPESEEALLAAWDATRNEDDRRALADALARTGSARAEARLALATESREEGDRRLRRASLIVARDRARERPAEIALDRETAVPTRIRFHCRLGLEPIVAEEIDPAMQPHVVGEGEVDARLSGRLACATSIRTMTHFGFPLDPVTPRGDVAGAIVDALLGREARSLMQTFTRGEGPVRFRLAWHGEGRRAISWRCAELVRERTRELVNDPTASTWEVVVEKRQNGLDVELVPRGFVDERFRYRQHVVPAASHPTLAAAIARVAPRRPDDVVWDPFVGSGAELVERARLGPYAWLLGTDVDGAAVEAARANLANAGVANARIELGDARSFRERASVILTNPPMGRRVRRGSHLVLLEALVAKAAELLPPEGCLVWIVPEPERIRDLARRKGFRVESAWTVDMGGFPAELAVYRLCRKGA